MLYICIRQLEVITITKTKKLNAMKNQSEWYAVPPYRVGENWKILNERGEIVAWFENKEDCILAVKLFNEKNKTNGKVD